MNSKHLKSFQCYCKLYSEYKRPDTQNSYLVRIVLTVSDPFQDNVSPTAVLSTYRWCSACIGSTILISFTHRQCCRLQRQASGIGRKSRSGLKCQNIHDSQEALEHMKSWIGPCCMYHCFVGIATSFCMRSDRHQSRAIFVRAITLRWLAPRLPYLALHVQGLSDSCILPD